MATWYDNNDKKNENSNNEEQTKRDETTKQNLIKMREELTPISTYKNE